jgi:ribosomal protein L40E
MTCPVCVQCGACGKEVAKKNYIKPGFCISCKTQNSIEADTCKKCGKPLKVLPPGVSDLRFSS